MKVVVSLLAVACAAIGIELGVMAHVASRRQAEAERARVFTADDNPPGQSPRGRGGRELWPIWPDDAEPVLGRKVAAVDIPPMSMEKALLEFQKQCGVNLVTPYHSIPVEARDATVEAHLSDVTVLQALRKLLDQANPQLHFKVRDGVIEIGDAIAVPKDDDENVPVTRVYDVRSLLPPHGVAAELPDASGIGGSATAADDERAPKNLVEVIEETVVPDSWSHAGGTGRIQVWNDSVLVIYQTPANHREVARFLWTLRKAMSAAPSPKPAGGGAAQTKESR